MGISGALLELIKSFLTNRFQRVVLNGQTSEWLPAKAGVPQESILDTLCFVIYINDLSVDITSTVKLIPDYTSLFSIVHDPNTNGKCYLTHYFPLFMILILMENVI